MARNSNLEQYHETGIIILGNTGAGKSYICNVLLGQDKFETKFQPDVVTTRTERQSITYSGKNFLVFNVPGLIEANDELIEQNKREINKAFQMCEESIVIFVWRETGGRAQNEDIIAFNALNSACEFPSESLMFVVNNVPSNRAPEYDAKFMVLLSRLLKSIKMSIDNTLFIENMDPTDRDRIEAERHTLWSYLSKMKPFIHKKQIEITLQLDQINQLKAAAKREVEEAERDKQKLQLEIDEMLRKISVDKQDSDNLARILKSKIKEFQRKCFPGKYTKILKILMVVGVLSCMVRLMLALCANQLPSVESSDFSLKSTLDCTEEGILLERNL